MLIIGFGFFWWFGTVSHNKNQIAEQDTSKELNVFLKSVNTQRHQNPSQIPSLHLQRFDPNSCDSLTLLYLGLKPWQAHIFLRYRSAGAKFHSMSDLQRVYGLSVKDLKRLALYAIFPVSSTYRKGLNFREKAFRRDSLHKIFIARFPTKLKIGEKVEVNTCDTLLLQKIPGIGSYFSRRICRYRELLGGYVSLSQLYEIPNMPSGIEKWFILSNYSVRKISINKAEFRDLLRHPYLNFEQVKAIFNHRRKYGKITSLNQLSTESAFKTEDLRRLQPYLLFK